MLHKFFFILALSTCLSLTSNCSAGLDPDLATPPTSNPESTNSNQSQLPKPSPTSDVSESPAPVAGPVNSAETPTPISISAPENLTLTFDDTIVSITWTDSNPKTSHYEVFFGEELIKDIGLNKRYNFQHNIDIKNTTSTFQKTFGVITVTPEGKSKKSQINIHLGVNFTQTCENTNYFVAQHPFTTPSPLSTESCAKAPSEQVAITGTLFDDNLNLVEGALINSNSLTPSLPYRDEVVSTREGNYTLFNVPTGAQIEITITKPGYAQRKRVVMTQPNPENNTAINRVDFGFNGRDKEFGDRSNALSEKPEVIKVSPQHNLKDVDPKAPIILTFSEPMNNASVENNFVVRDFTMAQRLDDFSGKKVFDKNDFDISWNSDDTEVTFSFKPFKELFSSTSSSLYYQISFSGTDEQNLQDKGGQQRKGEHFKLTEGVHEWSSSFQVKQANVF